MAAPERVVPGPSRGFVQSDKATPPVLAQLNASSPLAAHMQPGTNPQTSTYPREHAYQSKVSSASTACTSAAPQVIMWNRATVPLSAAPNGSSPSTGHMHTWPEPQRVQKQTSGSSPSAGQGLVWPEPQRIQGQASALLSAKACGSSPPTGAPANAASPAPVDRQLFPVPQRVSPPAVSSPVPPQTNQANTPSLAMLKQFHDVARDDRADREWIRHVLSLMSRTRAHILRRFDKRVLLTLFGVWQLGGRAVDRTEVEACAERFLKHGPKPLMLAAKWPPARTSVMVDVVHLSAGHGTGLICSERACEFLCHSFHVGGRETNVRMNSMQHYIVDSIQSHGLDLYEAYTPGLPCSRCFVERYRGGDPHQPMRALEHINGWTVAGCTSVILLVVDLGAFRERILQGTELRLVWDRQRLQQLKSWTRSLALTAGLDRIASAMIEVRNNGQPVLEMLGKSFSSSYCYDVSQKVNGIQRPMTVCAHPCRRLLERGATVEDLTEGVASTCFVQPMNASDQVYWATMVHDDVRYWHPEPGSNASTCKAPSELDSTWPDVLLSRVECTDEPTGRAQFMLHMHRVRTPNTNDIRYGGPEYFAHFLGLDKTDLLAKARQSLPCLGAINVPSGEPSSDCTVSQDSSLDVVWRARCGEVILCRNCARLVRQLGSSFEVNATSDVIARHLGALIRQAILGEADTGDRHFSHQLLDSNLWWPERVEPLE
jgi:hypothetical protein